MARRFIDASRPLVENRYFRNSLALISGTVVTQAIVFLFSPLLARTFGLADFGNLANYNAWVAILALLSSLRYEHAILVAQGDENTNRVVVLTAALSIVSFFAYGLIAVVTVCMPSRSSYLQHLHGIILFIPCGVVFVCLSSLLIQLNTKSGSFKRLGVVAALQAFLTVASQLILGWFKVEDGLIIGVIVGFIFSGAVLARLTLGRGSFAELRRDASLARLRQTARDFINFPRYALGADAINVLAQQFIPVFVLALFSPAVAGLYAFSIRVVRVPLIVVSTAVTGALRKEAVDRLHQHGQLTTLLKMTVRTLFLVALIPFVVMLLYSDQIFSTVFGDKWREAGRVVQILSPGILFEFVAFPLSVIFLVTNSQRYTLAIQLSGFGALLGALFIGKHLLHSFLSTCYLISGVMVVVNLVTVAFAVKMSRGGAPDYVEGPEPHPMPPGQSA